MTAPLTQPSFWILTALAGQRRHGYEILQETSLASDGRVHLKVTTLYAALERLEREGLVQTDGEEIVGGRARRYYILTEQGTTALKEEVVALEEQTRVARSRLIAAGYALSFSEGVSA
jgi:DNA-binding PadR family transcriptional regulator